MNKKLLICFVFIASSVCLPAQLKKEELNTARDAAYMNDFEKEIIYEINVLRSDPRNYLNAKFGSEIADLKEKVRRGEKNMTWIATTIGDKTDTIKYDRNEYELTRFQTLQAALDKSGTLPAFLPDETFFRLTGSGTDELSERDTIGYHIAGAVARSSSNVPYKPSADLIMDMIFQTDQSNTEQTINAGLFSALLTDDADDRIAIHDWEVKGDVSPFHFYVSLGAKLKTVNLLYKKAIEGLDNDLAQFVRPLEDGNLLVGTDDVIKLTDDNKIIWRYTVTDKGTYEIDCYNQLADGSFIFGGWNKVSKKKNLWLFKLDAGGKKVWEKSLPVREGQILALAEAVDKNGFSAVITESPSKKQMAQTLRSFDEAGNETGRFNLLIYSEGPISTRFNQDVTLIPVKNNGYYVFGATTNNMFEGYLYSKPKQGIDCSPDKYTMLEEHTIDKAYANFIVLKNPKGGFYAAYAAMSDEGKQEDYRLIALDDSLTTVWSKYLGGDKEDGVSSMVMDSRGNLVLAGFSYSGISGDKSEPAFEKDHCDVWVIKVSGNNGQKNWDKTITGPGCILEARLFFKQGKVGVIFREETHTMGAMIEEK